jgi:MYXO-CTERM domain-containing protein
VAAGRLRDGELGSSRRSVELDFRTRKPYVVAEKGSLEDANNPGCKAQWFRNARDAVKARFPGVLALVYFDQDLTARASTGVSIPPPPPPSSSFLLLLLLLLLLLRARRIPNPRPRQLIQRAAE